MAKELGPITYYRPRENLVLVGVTHQSARLRGRKARSPEIIQFEQTMKALDEILMEGSREGFKLNKRALGKEINYERMAVKIGKEKSIGMDEEADYWSFARRYGISAEEVLAFETLKAVILILEMEIVPDLRYVRDCVQSLYDSQPGDPPSLEIDEVTGSVYQLLLQTSGRTVELDKLLECGHEFVRYFGRIRDHEVYVPFIKSRVEEDPSKKIGVVIGGDHVNYMRSSSLLDRNPIVPYLSWTEYLESLDPRQAMEMRRISAELRR